MSFLKGKTAIITGAGYAVLSDGKDVLNLTDQEREYYYALSKKQAKDGAEK